MCCCLFVLAQPIEAALSEAGLTPANVDRVLFAGGVSRMPKLKDTLVTLFPSSTVFESKTNPEESVASGAAIASFLYASASPETVDGGKDAGKAGAKGGKGKGGKGGNAGAGSADAATAEPADVLGETVAMHHLGASVGAVHNDGRVAVALNRLSLLPATGACRIQAPVEGGVAVVTIVQGDSFEDASANLPLCKLPLTVKEAGASVVEVNVTVAVTKHGGVLVRAALPDGTHATCHVIHGHEHAPLKFDEVSPAPPVIEWASEVPAAVETPAVADKTPVAAAAATPVVAEVKPAPVVAPAPAPVPVKLAPAPAPAAAPIVSADDLD